MALSVWSLTPTVLSRPALFLPDALRALTGSPMAPVWRFHADDATPHRHQAWPRPRQLRRALNQNDWSIDFCHQAVILTIVHHYWSTLCVLPAVTTAARHTATSRGAADEAHASPLLSKKPNPWDLPTHRPFLVRPQLLTRHDPLPGGRDSVRLNGCARSPLVPAIPQVECGSPHGGEEVSNASHAAAMGRGGLRMRPRDRMGHRGASRDRFPGVPLWPGDV